MNTSPGTPFSQIFIRCRGALAAVTGFSLCVNVLMLTASIYMMQVFDRVLVSRSGETLVLLSLIAFIALAAMASLDIVRTRVLQKLGGWLDEGLSPVVLELTVSGACRSRSPKSAVRLRDLSEVKTFISGNSVLALLDAPWTPIFLAFMFMLHPLLGGMAVAGAILLLALAVANDALTRPAAATASGAGAGALGFAETAVERAIKRRESFQGIGGHDRHAVTLLCPAPGEKPRDAERLGAQVAP